jgi:hypothetical protein
VIRKENCVSIIFRVRKTATPLITEAVSVEIRKCEKIALVAENHGLLAPKCLATSMQARVLVFWTPRVVYPTSKGFQAQNPRLFYGIWATLVQNFHIAVQRIGLFATGNQR